MKPYFEDQEIHDRIKEYGPDRVYPMYSTLDLRQALMELDKGQLLVVLSLPLSYSRFPWEPPESYGWGFTDVDYPYLILCDIAGEFSPSTRISSLEAQVGRELFNNDEVVIGYGEDQALYIFTPPRESLLVYPGEVTLMRKSSAKSRTPLMVLDGTPCNSIKDYLVKFGLEDTYINRGRIMEWIRATTQGAEAKEIKRVATRFCLDDFTGYEMKTTNKKNSYAAFLHSQVGVIYGVRDMVKKVPHITRDQAKKVYLKFGLTPPSTIYHQIPKSTPAIRPKRKPQVGRTHSADEDLTFLIEKYKLRKSKRGIIMTMESGDDMVWKNPEELKDQLRSCGEELTITQIHEIWDQVKERGKAHG